MAAVSAANREKCRQPARLPLQNYSPRGKCVQKLPRRFDVKQRRSGDIIFDEPGQRADANQIIVDQPLRNTNDKNEARPLTFAKRNTDAAAPDAQDNLID
jgi:hypothetical protein